MADAVPERPVRSPRTPSLSARTPQPLLWPAAAFILGVWLSDASGRLGGELRFALHAVTVTIVVAASAGAWRSRMLATSAPAPRDRREVWIAGAAVLVGLMLGFARHQAALTLPPEHIARVLPTEAAPARLVGDVATTPTIQPSERRNPYTALLSSPVTRFVMTVRGLHDGGEVRSAAGAVRVSVTGRVAHLEPGDRIDVTGWLCPLRGPKNLGETDWARWHRLQGLSATLRVEGAEYVERVQPARHPLRVALTRLRGGARSLLFGPQANVEDDPQISLLAGLVLGQRSTISRTLNEAFRRTGSLHFLSVSGFHVGVLAATTWFVVEKLLRRRRAVAALATLLVLLLYLFVAEQNAPILRATIMGTLAMLALLSGRPFCPLNWLALSAVAILLISPFELFRPGFQLSFVQLLVLVTVVPRLYRAITRRRLEPGDPPAETHRLAGIVAARVGRWLLALALTCVCAWITALPLVLHHFRLLTPWGALQSFLLTPLVTTTVALGFLTVLGGAVLPPAGAAIGWALAGTTKALLWLVDLLACWPGTLVEVRQPPAWIVLVTYGLAAAAVALWISGDGDRVETAWTRRARRIGAGLAVSLIAAVWVGWMLRPAGTREYRLDVLAVGDGSAVLLTTPEREALVIDAGTTANWDVGASVNAALRELRVRRLHALVVSHANFDHFSGVPTVVAANPPRLFLTNAYLLHEADSSPGVRRLRRLLPVHTPPAIELEAGQSFTLGDAEVEVLWPPRGLDESSRPNDRALVLRVRVGKRSALLAGDVERAALGELCAAHEAGRLNLSSDVLVAPHHGGGDERALAALLRAVRPRAVIVSTGKSRPRLEALVHEVCGESCDVLSTRDLGALQVRWSEGSELRVVAPFAPQRGE